MTGQYWIQVNLSDEWQIEKGGEEFVKISSVVPRRPSVFKY